MCSERGGISENFNTVAEKAYDGNFIGAKESKRMVIHDTAFVAWCYEEIKGVLDKRRNQQFYGWISCREC